MFQLPNYTVSNQQTTAKVRSLPEEDSISWDRYPSFDYTDDLLTTVATRLPESRFTSCHVNRSFSFVRNEAKWRRRREVDDFMREMKFHKQLVHRNQARGRFRSSCVPKRTRREAGKQGSKEREGKRKRGANRELVELYRRRWDARDGRISRIPIWFRWERRKRSRKLVKYTTNVPNEPYVLSLRTTGLPEVLSATKGSSQRRGCLRNERWSVPSPFSSHWWWS